MRAAIYSRISADLTGRGLGVARQLEDSRALADKLDWQVVKTYDDNDISAYSGKTRPGFEAMLEDMKAGAFDALICWHTDRLYRNMKDLERVIEIADANRIEIRTVQGGTLDLSTSAGRMVARILGSVARQESEHGSERRKRANAQRAASGEWSTSRRPFGYTLKGEPLEPEATAIASAVHDVLSGKSIRQLVREWNAQGLQTAGTSKQWRAPMLRRVLMNPRYAALVVHQGRVVGKGNWKPIIDEATHHGIVAFLSDPSRTKQVGFERLYQGSGVYRCGVCEEPVRAWKPSDGKARAYMCVNGSHVRRQGDALDAYVDAIILGRLVAARRPPARPCCSSECRPRPCSPTDTEKCVAGPYGGARGFLRRRFDQGRATETGYGRIIQRAGYSGRRTCGGYSWEPGRTAAHKWSRR